MVSTSRSSAGIACTSERFSLFRAKMAATSAFFR